MVARNHHYLPQCYLKGFTKGGSKKSKLTVFDLKEGTRFETVPRNVGSARDFNRVDVAGYLPDVIESSLAEFEREAARSIRCLDEGGEFAGRARDALLNLIAILAIRSPQRREHWRQLQEHTLKIILGAALSSPSAWEGQIRKAQTGGYVSDVSTSYEDARKFYEEDDYDIVIARERHIVQEMDLVKPVLKLLHARDWCVLRSEGAGSPFIVTDNPVSLRWDNPEAMPQFFRSSPGYGMRNTSVYFPVSKRCALYGRFDEGERMVEVGSRLVASMNSRALLSVNRQVFSPTTAFKFVDAAGTVKPGSHLLSLFSSSASRE